MQNMLKLRQHALILTAALAALAAGFFAPAAQAANITVTNTTLNYRGNAGAGQRFVQFDVKWDASWRAIWTDAGGTSTNWDAAWIFVKYRPAGSTSGWSHATLSTNAGDHFAPAGSTLSVGLSTNSSGANFGAGVFLYRAANGSGSFTNAGVKLRWLYAADGIAEADRVDVRVQAVEMVYVPQGSFRLGDGGSAYAKFENGTNGGTFLMTNDNFILTLGGGSVGSMGNNNNANAAATDDFNDVTAQLLPAAYPKGYNAFYCMKYEISQGQYKDFLNSLSRAQQNTRVSTVTASYFAMSGVPKTKSVITNSYRNCISTPASVPAGQITFGCDFNTNGVFDEVGDGQDLACNFLAPSDLEAYADWVCLRPMTEPEYEKACRGPLTPVTYEAASGISVYSVTYITNFTGIDGSGTEMALPANANFQLTYFSDMFKQTNFITCGPVRCGIFAKAGSTRAQSGASYWGIMELTGNVNEFAVKVGRPEGRLFNGGHGNGALTSAGSPDVPTWPTSAGFACKGWLGIAQDAVSDRHVANNASGGRLEAFGGRAVRTAP